jgi:hypothetical protein
MNSYSKMDEVIYEIIERIPPEKREEIKNRLHSGDFPRTKAEATFAESFGDYVGAGIFWGWISAQRRSSNRLAADDCIYCFELLDIPVPRWIINDLPGLKLAEFTEKLLEKFLE